MSAIIPAEPSDLKAVQALLKESQLPFEDLTPEHLRHFLVVRHGESMAACIGMEHYDQAALLRSLAVHDFMRGGGWGQQLVAALEAEARSQGVTAIYLLTTTAASFFERLGYQRIDRVQAPAAMQATTQFSQLCPSSSACLTKSI